MAAGHHVTPRKYSLSPLHPICLVRSKEPVALLTGDRQSNVWLTEYSPYIAVTCEPGYRMNVENNTCESCPAGTAAPGDVFVVNSWPKMPSQFFSDVISTESSAKCSQFGWKPENSHILGTANSMCATELTLENKNIRVGKITFEYKMTDLYSLAYFTIRNQRCVLVGGNSHILSPTPKDQWNTFTLSVPSGTSTIQWYLFSENYFDMNSPGIQFKLRSVEITGRAATMNCLDCEPGYYSDESGASECKKCPFNTYSLKRAVNCTRCKDNEYAIPGSGSCKIKSSCKPTEYVTAFSACDPATDTQKLETKLIEPTICNNDRPPQQLSNPVSCKACPPGTTQSNSTHCESCKPGQLSTPDGKACQVCPKDEAPIFGIKYTNWTRFPPRLSTYCIDEEVVCQTWQLNGSSIFVGPGLENYIISFLELDLSDGFLSSRPLEGGYFSRYAAPLPGTKLVFEFELDCEGDCVLSLVMCRAFEQCLRRFEPFDCDGVKFMWYFRKRSAFEDAYDPARRADRAIIYSIEMNNTRNTSAIGCRKCPLGVEGQFGYTIESSTLFTPQGNGYQHHFKLFFDTNKPNLRSRCEDRYFGRNVTAWVCRETWYPNKDDSDYDRRSSMSLGDKLQKAVSTNSSAEFRKEINSRLINAGWKPDYSGADYHLFFHTKTTTSACKNGISTIVTLRCGEIMDETNKNSRSNDLAQIQIPPKCAVGTCDGCVFHFMLVSPLACPTCKMEDYKRIEGGCRGGTMEITLLPPKYCHPPSNFSTVFEQSCPLLSTQGKIAVGLTLTLVILLLLTIFYCYQRNKKLEYKYMKLVEGAEARAKSSFGSSGSDANQQGTECGIPEDEKETELYPNRFVSAIAGGQSDKKWNTLTPSTSGDNGAGFGPVIFRSRTADDSHILTLDDGNEPI
nr:expressed protein [Hymenolepis microstoma]